MSFLDGLRHRIGVLLRGEQYARDVRREIQTHLDLQTLAGSASSQHAHDAELRARREFGNVTYYREEVRRMTMFGWLDGLRQDISYAWRGIRRAPGFAATVIVTIGLGLGVNAAMFSLLDHLLVQTPPGVAQPGNLRRLYTEVSRPREPGGRMAFDFFQYPSVRAIEAAEDSTLQLGVFSSPDSVLVTDGTRRSPAMLSFASRRYFQVLGQRPQLGRFFAPEEEPIETPTRVVVLSDAFWRRAFDANPGVLGRVLRMHQSQFTVVGVAAPDFSGIDLDRADLWVPLNTFEGSTGLPGPWYESFAGSFRIVTRLESHAREQQVLDIATRAERTVHIPYFQYDSTVRVIAGPIVRALGPAQRGAEVTVATRIGGVSVIVLLIAAANVANLLLLRASRRKREIALRRALGVSQTRLARQLAVESTVLILLGGVAASILAIWAGSALRRLVMPNVHWSSGALDVRTAAFVAISSVIIGIATGMAPLAMAGRLDLADSLKAGGRDSSYQPSRLRSGLLALQAALCMILLVGAGLFVRSLGNIASVTTGFGPPAQILLVRPLYDDEASHRDETAVAIRSVSDRVAGLSGVKASAYTTVTPLGGNAYMQVFLPGSVPLPTLGRDRLPSVSGVSRDYFRAVGIPVRQGRVFGPTDNASSPRVAIVSETMARVYWPGEDAIGKCLILDEKTNPCSSVVGVVADAHRMNLIEQPALQYYVPAEQTTFKVSTLVVSASRERVMGVRREIDGLLRQQLPNMAASRAQTLLDMVEPELRPWRLSATLFTALGLLAAAVAAVGIYSVVAYGVSQRIHEIGVRIALGARASNIVDLVLADGLKVVMIGIALGIASSLALGRLVAAFLFGITANDASVMIGAATGLCVIGTLACLVPAWRAARVDPAVALRTD